MTILDRLEAAEKAWRGGRENYAEHQQHRGLMVRHAADLIEVARAAEQFALSVEEEHQNARTYALDDALAPLLQDDVEGEA